MLEAFLCAQDVPPAKQYALHVTCEQGCKPFLNTVWEALVSELWKYFENDIII